MFIFIFLYLFTYLFIYLLIYFIYVFIYLFIYLSIYLITYLFNIYFFFIFILIYLIQLQGTQELKASIERGLEEGEEHQRYKPPTFHKISAGKSGPRRVLSLGLSSKTLRLQRTMIPQCHRGEMAPADLDLACCGKLTASGGTIC